MGSSERLEAGMLLEVPPPPEDVAPYLERVLGVSGYVAL